MSDIGAMNSASEPVAVNGVETGTPVDTGPTLDQQLHAIFEKNHVTNGADRGADGKFTNTETPSGGEAEPSSAASSPPPEGEAAGAEGAEPTLAAQSVPLPANMRGLESEWAKVPPDVQAKMAPHLEQLHQTLSTQGQTVAAYKPIKEFIDANQDIFGRNKPDGTKAAPHEVVSNLIGYQRLLEKDLVAGVLGIAQSYDITPQQLVNAIAARAVNGNAQPDVTTKLANIERTLSQLADPKAIETKINERLAADRQMTNLEGEVNRWSKDKPFYRELTKDEAAETVFANFITMARQKLGETAQLSAVLDRAYDMAVNADPDLRAKAAAAKAAAVQDPRKAAEARRAQQVNVTSTSSGKAKEPDLDDQLRAIYRENHKGN